MEPTLIKELPNLGIGVASVTVLYLCFKLFVSTLDKRETSFIAYVEANNHKSVEVMTECRDAIKKSSENIEANTEVQKALIQKLCEK